MLNVILLYNRDCPNIAGSRTNLIKAFAASSKEPSWVEVDRSADDTPPKLRGYGSPTILVNGLDVAGQKPDLDAANCRLYWDLPRNNPFFYSQCNDLPIA